MNRPELNDFEVRPPQPDETTQIVRLLTDGESEMRRHLITSSVSGALNNATATTICLVAATSDQVLGAAIASSLPSGSGVLVGLRIGNDLPTDVARVLFQSLTHYLETLGVRFLQATCDTDEPPAEWVAIDLKHLADLDYLAADAVRIEASPSPELTFVDATDFSEDQIVAIVERTFVDTLDCPMMGQYRSASETIASYKAAPQYDPTAWRIAMHDGAPVGCVLTIPFVESQSLELTYMGIVPEARGNRFGRSLVAEAKRMAELRSLASINLGVDRNNAPALDMYRDCGFTSFFSEAVWGTRLDG